MWFPNRIRIVEIPLRLGEQKDVFVRPCRPVRHALRHRIGLGPDDVRSQIPAVRLEREGDAPWDAAKVFRLEAGGSIVTWTGDAVACLMVGMATESAARVAIPQIQPAHPVIPQHPPDLAEHAHHRLHVSVRRRLKAYLPANAIIPQASFTSRAAKSRRIARNRRAEGYFSYPP